MTYNELLQQIDRIHATALAIEHHPMRRRDYDSFDAYFDAGQALSDRLDDLCREARRAVITLRDEHYGS